jgi:hypothetical protein
VTAASTSSVTSPTGLVEAGWTAAEPPVRVRTASAGSNPVPIRLRKADLAEPVVHDLLRATFEILASGALPWSERQTQPLLEGAGTDATGTPLGIGSANDA